MDIIAIQCLEINDYSADGYYLVVFAVSSNDPEMYTSATFNLTMADASGLEVGKFYDLKLNEII
jgi:hypothetical protein